MKALTFPIYVIVQSKTSSIAAPFFGHTFQLQDMTPIYMIVNINGQESTLSHKEVAIIDIENIYRQVIEEQEEFNTFMAKRKTKATKEYTDKQSMINSLAACLKDYLNVHQIKIEHE